MIKKLVSIALFIFFAIIVAILVAGLVFSSKKTTAPTLTSTSTPQNVSKNPPVEISPGAKTISLAEVAKHKTATDCWQAISGNIYDLTPFLDQHPAGAESMIPYCGQDSTNAYDTKGGQGSPHSGQAERILPTYFVGRLSQ